MAKVKEENNILDLDIPVFNNLCHILNCDGRWVELGKLNAY